MLTLLLIVPIRSFALEAHAAHPSSWPFLGLRPMMRMQFFDTRRKKLPGLSKQTNKNKKNGMGPSPNGQNIRKQRFRMAAILSMFVLFGCCSPSPPRTSQPQNPKPRAERKPRRWRQGEVEGTRLDQAEQLKAVLGTSHGKRVVRMSPKCFKWKRLLFLITEKKMRSMTSE